MIYKVKDRESIAVSNTAIGLTASKLKDSDGRLHTYAQIQVLPKKADGNTAGQIRVTDDGTAPVAVTTGMLFNQGDIFEVWGADGLSNFKAIRETSTDGYLEVTYYG